MNYLIDTHCHLHDPEFFSKAEQKTLLEQAYNVNVKKLICVGTSSADSLRARDFASKHPDVFWSYGIHPSELENASSSDAEELFASPPVAIGEVGLDYHYESNNREAQIALFEQMLNLALQLDLPLIFHVREAFDDFFPVIDNFTSTFAEQGKTLRGVVHSFSDSKKNLKRALDHNFYIGVNGLATYSTLPLPPLDRTLLETDAPFLAPVPHRGEKNSSAFIPDIALWLAHQHDTTITEVAKITTKNAKSLFLLS